MNFRITPRGAAAALAVAAAAVALPAQAAFSSVTVFGDSLSDTGNLYLFTGGAQPPAGQPYAFWGFSNGLLWTDRIATTLGAAAGALPSLAGGTNYAWAGARVNGGAVPSVLAQLSVSAPGFWGGRPADPSGLYILAAGGNDMRDARTAYQTDSVADQAGRQAAADAAAGGLQAALGLLAARGAKNVLLANLPDLGNTPEALGLGLAAPSSDATARFNAHFPSLLGYGSSIGLAMSFLDLAALGNAIRADALGNGGGVYGITNVFFPCAGFAGSNGASCDVSAFSDGLHPSARTHQIFANAAIAAVPEPAAMLTMALGLVGVLGAARRRQVR